MIDIYTIVTDEMFPHTHPRTKLHFVCNHSYMTVYISSILSTSKATKQIRD